MLIGRRDDGDQRCMGTKVIFSSATEQTLRPAWPQGVKERWLKSRQLPHFGVDSATAGIFSVDVADKIAALVPEQLAIDCTADNPYLSKSEEALWRRVTLEGNCRALIAFSGLGDGAYHAYFSYDAQSKPLALYVDFGFFGPPTWDWHW